MLVAGYWLLATCHLLLDAGCLSGLRDAGCGLRVASCGLRVAGCTNRLKAQGSRRRAIEFCLDVGCGFKRIDYFLLKIEYLRNSIDLKIV